MYSFAFALCKTFRVRAWDGPFGDVGVEWGRQGWKGPGSGRRLRKERFTGHLHRSLLDHTTRGPTGGRDKESVIDLSSQVITLREA